ncbi:hypothetical protein E2562_022566 [Oryza meyeriana var. granulata]|uniref:MATH domain-containing protein n=1 Tax=Oryza meyeriana var. granulata TaxID=110450 RepID=A0A6G1CHV3_9ORYZ|nr:hypothetical protein E2562_022566 [Oryza meyeriana var. granulata]
MAAASTVTPSSSTTSPPLNTMSTHSTELVKGTHQFTVAGYSLQKRKATGHFIRSGSFEVGGYSWAVLFYPAGCKEEGHVSVFLDLQSTVAEKVTEKFTFHITNSADASSSFFGRSDWTDFTPTTKSLGYREFMEIETLESQYMIV